MAWGAHVRVDATVRTIGATAVLVCPVHLDVGHEQLVDLKALELSVGLSVGEEVQHKLSGLLGPPGLTVGRSSVLGLGSAANTTAEATEWNGLLVLNDMLQVGLSLLQVHA